MANHPDPSQSTTLSIARADPERRLGLPGGRFTHPSHLATIVLAGLLTAAVYAAITPLEGTWIHATLTQRGPIPYAIALCSSWALLILLVKRLKITTQARALAVEVIPSDPGFVITPATAQEVLDSIHLKVDDPQSFILFNRIHVALSNLRNIGRVADVDEILLSQASHDESTAESSYTILRGLVWGIPVLGFIGTVMGLSTAIGSFGEVLAAGADTDRLRDGLSLVTSGLAVAFETTLQALVAAFVIHMLLTFVRRREERLLDDCREYCQRRIVSRLRLDLPPGAED